MNAHKQRGMVLLVSLILLLMLTLIAITASSQSTLQLRISSNSEQNNLAFQAAEAGIANWIGSYFSVPLIDLYTIGRVDGTAQNPLPTSTKLGSDAAIEIDINESSVGLLGGYALSAGSGVREMYSFNLKVKGGSACDNNEIITTCAATVIHYQGGQLAGQIQ